MQQPALMFPQREANRTLVLPLNGMLHASPLTVTIPSKLCYHPPQPICLVALTVNHLSRTLTCVPRACAGRLERSKKQVYQTGLINKRLKPSPLTFQIPIVVQLSQQTKLDLPPLIWALAMGCNLGGEYTLNICINL